MANQRFISRVWNRDEWMGDLNKLTFSGFPEAWGNDRRGLRRNFLLVTDVMNTDDMILARMHSVLVQPISKHELLWMDRR